MNHIYIVSYSNHEYPEDRIDLKFMVWAKDKIEAEKLAWHDVAEYEKGNGVVFDWIDEYEELTYIGEQQESHVLTEL